MDRSLIKDFWNCGDSYIIEFALIRARLNRVENDVLHLMLDECMTQEQAAEKMGLSTRTVQKAWSNACDKLLSIKWVSAYAKELHK